MPIFKVEVVLATGESVFGYRDVPDMTLDDYYQFARKKAQEKWGTAIATFDCVMISSHSHIAAVMRSYNATSWPPKEKR